jgi:hypothetical protein
MGERPWFCTVFDDIEYERAFLVGCDTIYIGCAGKIRSVSLVRMLKCAMNRLDLFDHRQGSSSSDAGRGMFFAVGRRFLTWFFGLVVEDRIAVG